MWPGLPWIPTGQLPIHCLIGRLPAHMLSEMIFSWPVAVGIILHSFSYFILFFIYTGIVSSYWSIKKEVSYNFYSFHFFSLIKFEYVR